MKILQVHKQKQWYNVIFFTLHTNYKNSEEIREFMPLQQSNYSNYHSLKIGFLGKKKKIKKKILHLDFSSGDA